jgi:hypothetical protein
LRGELAGEGDDGGFGGGVAGQPVAVEADGRRRRGDVDDDPAALGEHPPADELGEREQAGQVRLDQVLDVLGRLVLGGPGVGDACIVDEYVHPPEAFVDRADEGLAVGRVAAVARHRQGLAQLRGERDVEVVAAGGEDDAGARAVQHLCEAPAQARRRAGHERDPTVENLVLEPGHGVRR